MRTHSDIGLPTTLLQLVCRSLSSNFADHVLALFIIFLPLSSDIKIEEFSQFSKTMEQNVQRFYERCQSYGLKYDGGKPTIWLCLILVLLFFVSKSGCNVILPYTVCICGF